MIQVLSVIGGILWFLLRILLVILAVLLVLILLILILPIRYEIFARGSSEHIKAVEAKVLIDVFFGLAKVRAALKEGTLRFSARVLMFTLKKGKTTIFSMEESAAEAASDSPEELSAEDTSDASEVSTEDVLPETSEETSEEEPGETSEGEPEEDTSTLEEVLEEIRREETTDSGEKTEGNRREAAEERKKKKKRKSSPKPPKTEPGPLQKIRDLLDQIREPKNVRSFHRVKREFFRILKHILPRKLRIHGVVGTGDPASTGWILGIFYMFYPVYGDSGDYRLVGDFERMILEGKCYARGRIHLIVPVFSAVILFLDGNIRRLIKKVRQG